MTNLSCLGLKSRTKKASQLMPRDLSSPEKTSKMKELSPITTCRRNPPSIWSWDSVEPVWERWRSSPLSQTLLESTRLKKWFAESVTSDCHSRPTTAERESVVTGVTSDSRRRSRADHVFSPSHGALEISTSQNSASSTGPSQRGPYDCSVSLDNL